MKILNLVRFFPKISETFIIDNLIGQIESGIECMIVAYTDPRKSLALEDRQLEETKHAIIDKYNLMEKTYYIDPNEYGSLTTLIQKEKPDIIQIHFGDLAPLILQNNDIGNIPLIITYHGIVMPKNSDTRNLESENYKNTFERANIILTVSDKWRNDLITLGAPKEKVKVHRLGVFYDNFVNKTNYDINNPFSCVSIGRLVEKKGFHNVIKAVAILQKENILIKYDIIGDGVEFMNLQSLIAELSHPEFVKILGKKDREYIQKELHNYDCFIATSVTAADGDEEGIPVTIMEAAGVGLPIITTYHGGIPEIIENNVSGILLEENDIDEIANAIKQLMNSTNFRKELGNNAKKTVLDKYNGYTQQDKLVNMYKSLL